MIIIFPDIPRQTSEPKQFQQSATWRPSGRSKRGWWTHPVARYGFIFPIVASGMSVTLLGEYLLEHYYFPSVSVLVAILCSALFLGSGPGLLALLVSCFALVYLYLLPSQSFGWEVLFQLFPLIVASLVMIIIIRQREAALQQALQAEQEIQAHAQDLARANHDLLQANQLKDLFVSITSHELKTPITTIRGQAQLALRRLKKHTATSPELDGLKDAFVKVDEQTSRLTQLLNELLDLTSLRSGKQVLTPKACNLNEICSGVVEEQRLHSERTIELDLPSEPILLQADAARLGQVVTNLVSNALKYSPPESAVKVKVEGKDELVHFEVQDAGQGISPEQQENIFQPFYRTSDARASTIGGTGLGLAICKDIVEQHDGRIWCESRSGDGSTFFVELPVAPPGPLKDQAFRALHLLT